jgi:tetratricopeptide (TPR) repeat protein
MSEEALFERYKSALRIGHIAAVRGKHEAAVAAYSDAATLAPDRPLPHTSMGRALLQLGRTDEALAAFAEALRLAPRDETSLAGRADALAAAGRQAEAAGVLDLLAETQFADGRVPDACDTVRRALELAESRARRRHLEALAAELKTWPVERGGAEQLASAMRMLEAPVAELRADAPGAGAPRSIPALPIDLTPAAEPEPPPLDASALSIAVEAAVEAGDPGVVHAVILDAVSELRRAGLLDAALDACQLGLTVVPSDPYLHLALAELDLDLGWTTAATDKLTILDRFVELTDNGPARDRLRELVATRMPDHPRLSTPPA